jgi:hypothetical protein
MKSKLMTALAIVTVAGCAAEPSHTTDIDPNAVASKADDGADLADHDCRVFLFDAQIPSHGAVDGDFNQVSAVDGLQDTSGNYWWPFAADIGVGRYVPAGVKVGIAYSIDNQHWQAAETSNSSLSNGIATYHLDWGENLFAFESGSLLLCPPGSLRDCLTAQPELRPMHVEAYVRMPDGTVYFDHNTANNDTWLAGDLSNLSLDAGDGWQSPQRDLLHCVQPGT